MIFGNIPFDTFVLYILGSSLQAYTKCGLLSLLCICAQYHEKKFGVFMCINFLVLPLKSHSSNMRWFTFIYYPHELLINLYYTSLRSWENEKTRSHASLLPLLVTGFCFLGHWIVGWLSFFFVCLIALMLGRLVQSVILVNLGLKSFCVNWDQMQEFASQAVLDSAATRVGLSRWFSQFSENPKLTSTEILPFQEVEAEILTCKVLSNNPSRFNLCYH